MRSPDIRRRQPAMPRFTLLPPAFPPELDMSTTTTSTPAPLLHGSVPNPVVDPTLFSFLLLVGLFTFFLLRILVEHLRDRAAAAADSDPCDSKAAWGFDHQALTTMPVLSYAEAAAEGLGTGCAVCLEEFGEDDPVRVLHACRHTFHYDCIDAWLVEHVTCPICRADLEAPSPASWSYS